MESLGVVRTTRELLLAFIEQDQDFRHFIWMETCLFCFPASEPRMQLQLITSSKYFFQGSNLRWRQGWNHHPLKRRSQCPLFGTFVSAILGNHISNGDPYWVIGHLHSASVLPDATRVLHMAANTEWPRDIFQWKSVRHFNLMCILLCLLSLPAVAPWASLHLLKLYLWCEFSPWDINMSKLVITKCIRTVVLIKQKTSGL